MLTLKQKLAAAKAEVAKLSARLDVWENDDITISNTPDTLDYRRLAARYIQTIHDYRNKVRQRIKENEA